MPLLKKKTLEKAPMPEFLRDDEEVFLCEMTNEIFRDYEEFAERTILCNSMVWTCSMTGKMNLTYEEALASEKSAKKILQDFPNELKVPMLFVANQTERGSFRDMADDVYMYIKDRFFLGETVEACFAVNKWKDYQVVQVIAPTEDEIKEKRNGDTSTNIPANLYKYDLEHKNSEDEDISEKLMVDMTQIRRKKSLYSKDKSKLFLKQYVVQNSDGHLGINPTALSSFGITNMSYSKIFDGPEPNFDKSKRKTNIKKVRQETLAKFLTKNNLIDNYTQKGITEQAKVKKRLVDEDTKAKQKLKAVELASKVKEWYQVKDDLTLEDHKALPQPIPVKTKIPDKFLGDVLCVMEFVENFSKVLETKNYFGVKGLTLEVMEKALIEKKVGGPLIDILIMLIEAIFTFQEEEEKSYKMELEKVSKKEFMEIEESTDIGYEEIIQMSTVISDWPRKYHGTSLKMLPVCPVTVSEILRLHLLTSGARLMDSHGSRMRSLCRGGFTSEDDPAIEFRLHNSHILRALSIHNVAELSLGDKLKLLTCLVNQLLTYKQIRDVIDERMDSIKDMRSKIRQINANEKKRQQEVDEQSKLEKKGEKVNGSNTDEHTPTVEEKMERRERLVRDSKNFKETAEMQIEKLHRGIFDSTILIGYDRAFRRYLKLSSVPGLFVNQEDPNAGRCLSEPVFNVPELASGERSVILKHIRKMHEEMNSSDKENEPKEEPITLNGNAPLNNKNITMINNLYMCSADPTACIVHPTQPPDHMWMFYQDQNSLEELINCLNKRGIKEADLQNNLKSGLEVFTKIVNSTPSYLQVVEKMEDDTEAEVVQHKKGTAHENFGYSDDMLPSEILCASVIENLVEFEEKLQKNGLGGFPNINRDKLISLLEEKKFDELLEELDNAESNNKENRSKEENPDDVSDTSETDGEEYRDPLDYLKINTADIESEDSECDPNDIVLMQSTEEKKRISALAKTLVYIAHSIKQKCLFLPIGTALKKKHVGIKTSVMKNWEKSLLHATNYAQIFVHHASLKSCVAWGRSIGHTNCKQCGKKIYQSYMMICDSCNVGLHTFCAKPKIEKVPEGKWLCSGCTEEIKESEAQEEEQIEESFSYDAELNPKDCNTCGELECGEVVRCNHCPRVYHLECVAPPIRRVPRTYKCTTCKVDEKDSKSLAEKITEDPLRRSNRVRDEAKNGLPLHNAALQELLVDVMKHEDAWPFITPVQKREVPDYYDVISHPMDFGTIKYKLNMGDYKFDEELMSDIQLVFENCNTYNSSEDDVFKCGVRLLKYVIKRANEANLKTKILSDIDIIDEEDDQPKSKKMRTV